MSFGSTNVIEAQARKIFGTDDARARLNPKLPEGYLVANNSFLHREGAKFTKSGVYLAVPVDEGGKARVSTPLLVKGITKNADFDFIASSAFGGQTVSLEKGLPDLIKHFGRLAFILLGRIEPGGPYEEPIASNVFTRLLYDRTLNKDFEIAGNDLRINKLFDEDRLWTLVHGSPGWEPEKNVAAQLAAALDRLRAQAHDSLIVPESAEEVPKDSLLDQMTAAFRAGAAEYGLALKRWKQDQSQSALNEVMRLAYNFSSDAMQLAEFVMALSDLKPMILLLTIDEQYRFAQAVRAILKRRAVHKPSLRGYSDVISDARSAAFHRLIPFDATIEVDHLELSGVRLRLFPEYEERRSNVLDYEDRPLLELLTQMTRPTVRELEAAFWDENETVMAATLDLLEALRSALVIVLQDVAANS